MKAKTSLVVVSSRILPSNLVLDTYLGLINLRILVKIPLKLITNLDILMLLGAMAGSTGGGITSSSNN